MKKNFIEIPAAQVSINDEEQKLTRRRVLDTIFSLDLSLIGLKKIANAFGG
jgi:hypothetical protein